jgi:hypothetical protein
MIGELGAKRMFVIQAGDSTFRAFVVHRLQSATEGFVIVRLIVTSSGRFIVAGLVLSCSFGVIILSTRAAVSRPYRRLLNDLCRLSSQARPRMR